MVSVASQTEEVMALVTYPSIILVDGLATRDFWLFTHVAIWNKVARALKAFVIVAIQAVLVPVRASFTIVFIMIEVVSVHTFLAEVMGMTTHMTDLVVVRSPVERHLAVGERFEAASTSSLEEHASDTLIACSPRRAVSAAFNCAISTHHSIPVVTFLAVFTIIRDRAIIVFMNRQISRLSGQFFIKTKFESGNTRHSVSLRHSSTSA